MDSLTQRNIQALSQGLNQLNSKIADLELYNQHLRTSITTLQNQVNAMATTIALLRVKSLGSGPTV